MEASRPAPKYRVRPEKATARALRLASREVGRTAEARLSARDEAWRGALARGATAEEGREAARVAYAAHTPAVEEATALWESLAGVRY